nr:MAG TPA_asm: hypothetical protein [Caudoviricetes sp.]
MLQLFSKNSKLFHKISICIFYITMVIKKRL